MKKILTIIIPSYNMQDYLHRSVGSLIDGQIMDDVEIIIVNDGSTDTTSAIAHGYQKDYPASVVVIDKANGHYGSAVNAGIQKATGKYLKILDADDWFDTSGFVKYVKQLSCIDTVDVVFTHWTLHNMRTDQRTSSCRPQYPYHVPLKADSLVMPFSTNTFCSLYGLTYRTDFLKRINYVQTEGVCYTDTEYVYYPLMKADMVSFIDAEVYQYYLGREGQSVNVLVQRKNVSHYYRILNRLMDTYEPPTTAMRKAIQGHVFNMVGGTFYFLCLSGNASDDIKYGLKTIDKRIKSLSPDIYRLLGRKKYCKLPYIKLWRLFGFKIGNVYNLLTSLRKIKR